MKDEARLPGQGRMWGSWPGRKEWFFRPRGKAMTGDILQARPPRQACGLERRIPVPGGSNSRLLPDLHPVPLSEMSAGGWTCPQRDRS